MAHSRFAGGDLLCIGAQLRQFGDELVGASDRQRAPDLLRGGVIAREDFAHQLLSGGRQGHAIGAPVGGAVGALL